MCFGPRKPIPPPLRPTGPPGSPLYHYDYGDMPSNPLPSGYTFNPYVSSLQPDQVYLVGVFLSQIVDFTTRPQSRDPFAPRLDIASLVYPDWVSQEVRSGVHSSLPPDLLRPDGVPLLLQCPPGFAEQLQQQAQVVARPHPEVIYFGWRYIPMAEES
ncbi:hypothetical protein I302_106608 [Kwoniella bestiolae CBS 10118]|uniref:Uncharacterized protein n=1 Tax=Kwoniella bestiolae CBS 10118 TaxID=1296100 RepID=A0A1B9G0Y4_9TREE|nr:hypothetical protein I302_06131 [Kwoniella bestiolae CBS 10118]OCF24670.1 hypothetical protein I302_06131 [Kwoniella bestiolae CBS 10118]